MGARKVDGGRFRANFSANGKLIRIGTGRLTALVTMAAVPLQGQVSG